LIFGYAPEDRLTDENNSSTPSVALSAVKRIVIAPAESQSSNEIVRIENDYRECLYAKAKDGRYAKRERDSDFGLLRECRNQWVAYMDLCAKSGFDNRMCVVKSRLLIHAILNLTGK